jgi:hypothetical protein
LHWRSNSKSSQCILIYKSPEEKFSFKQIFLSIKARICQVKWKSVYMKQAVSLMSGWIAEVVTSVSNANAHVCLKIVMTNYKLLLVLDTMACCVVLTWELWCCQIISDIFPLNFYHFLTFFLFRKWSKVILSLGVHKISVISWS